MNNNMRVSGLASGMDIDQIVKDLMRAERMRVDSLKQKKQLAEWKRSDYRTVNSSLMTLKNLAFNMKLEGTFMAMSATSSNQGTVKAIALPTATAGVNTIKVDRLAQSAYVTSTAAMGSGDNKSTLQTQFSLAAAQDITININGVDLTVNTGTDSMTALVDKINNLKKPDGTSVGIKASYDATLDRIFLNTTDTIPMAERLL